MLTDEERFALVLVKRKELEAELKEAEILLGLIKTNLARADVLFQQFELAFEDVVKGGERRKVRKITPEMDKVIETMWKKKVSISKIARELGVVDITVKRRLQALGFLSSLKVRDKVSKQQAREFVEKFRSGKSMTKIAREAGVSTTTVSNHLKKLGFDIETHQNKILRGLK